MSPKKQRPPSAFRLSDPAVQVEDPSEAATGRAGGTAGTSINYEADDPFTADAASPVAKAEPSPRRWRVGRLFMAAAGALLTLAVGVLVTEFVAALFDRATWLGWIGLVLAVIAALAFLALVIREAAGLMRLSHVTRLRAKAEEAAASDDRDAARAIAREVIALYARRPESARGRANLGEHVEEIIDGRDLMRLAERELMTPLDAQARALVTAAAQRVSVVTAVSPRALIDVLFVAFESLRLVRRIGTLYGGRPSGLALLRLARLALAHLAITGGLAMTDGLMHQVVGHGLAARLSARLGEGLVNGLMTARIGLAALDVCRPLPWLANRPPGLREVMATLAGTGAGAPPTQSSP